MSVKTKKSVKKKFVVTASLPEGMSASKLQAFIKDAVNSYQKDGTSVQVTVSLLREEPAKATASGSN